MKGGNYMISEFEKLSKINTNGKLFSEVIMELSIKWNKFDKDTQDAICKEIMNVVE
jgi:hypothetical protein